MKKVLCPGEALIDLVSDDSHANLSKTEKFIKKAGGAPANSACAMSKFGVKSYFLGAVGSDPFGHYLIQEMKKYNIETDYVYKSNKPTTLAFVALSSDGERDFEFVRGSDQDIEIEDYNQFADFSCFHFASATAFLGGKLEVVYNQLLEYAVDNQKYITFDANYRDALFGDKKEMFIEKCQKFISKSNLVKLSEEEARLISGKNDLSEAGLFIKSLGCEHLVITLGKKGTLYFYQDKEYSILTQEVKMVDATGAGDAYIGSLIAQIINEEKIDHHKMMNFIKISSKVGAITTQKKGALSSIPKMEEVLNNNQI